LPARTPVLRQIAEVVLGVYDQELGVQGWHGQMPRSNALGDSM
jgi:hypothetical protein